MSLEAVAPAESASFLALVAAADRAGIDAEILREILWLTTAHCHLLSFATAAERIISILNVVPDGWSSAIGDAGLERWRDVLDWVIQNKGKLAPEVGEHFTKTVNTTKSNPIRGSGSAEFPFYAVLCEPLPMGADRDRFLLLSGHLLIAHVLAMREHSSLPEYELNGPAKKWVFLPNRVDNAARAVRRLSEKKGLPLLALLPVDLAPEVFAEILEEQEVPDDEDLRRDHPGLYRFLQKAWEIIDWREKDGGGGGGGSGGHRWVGGRLEGSRLTIERQWAGDDEDPAGGWGSTDLVKFKSASSRKKNARLSSDLPPDEDDDEEEVLLSDYECEVTKQDAGALARAARAKTRHVAKSNQALAWAYDRLADAEVRRLIGRLRADRDALLAITDWTQDDRLKAEAIFVMVTMLLTASDLTRAVNVLLVDQLKVIKDLELGLVVSGSRPVTQLRWRVRTLKPDYKTDFDGNIEELRPQAEHFDLPEPFGLASLVNRLIGSRVRVLHDQVIVKTTEKNLTGVISAWLKSQYPDGRLTTNKIQGVLWSTVFQNVGDAAVASCVTGVMHPLARVRLHYTSPWICNLQEHYIRAVFPLIAEGNEENPASFDAPEMRPVATAGARLCPTVTAVRSMFDRLRNDIERTADYYDRQEFRLHHNLLTLYAVQFFAYSTTCRAIVTPYQSPRTINPARALVSLSDKDDESRHKTRLVWIPPALYDQMTCYEAHLSSVKAQLFDRPAAIVNEPCLFFDEDFKPQLVRPKTLEPILNQYLQIRANTHRRFLRTELLERGCHGEIVDAFMGHWQAGEEPFGHFSSFSFEDYVAELKQFLLPLLSDIGLVRAIDGRLSS